jgi:EmrB/QacA subfamily drug resistance transporter
MLLDKRPCDDGVILGTPCAADAATGASTTASPTAPPLRPSWILAATILGSSMAFIDGTVVNLALPVLQTSFGASVAGVQWVVEAYALLLAALLLVGGALGDRYGRRRIFMLGVGLFALASVACGLARSLEELIAARAVQGVAGALLVPGSLAVIGASFPKQERGRAIGMWSGFSAISSGLGLLLGGWLLDVASWRVIFWINVPMAAVTLFLAARAVPESRAEEAHAPLDVLGAALVTLGLAGLTFGFVEAPERGWRAPAVAGSLAGGALLLAAFLLVEARRPHPMLPLSLFRVREFTAANLLTFFLYAALAGAMFFFPLNLIQVQGYTATEAGAANLPFILLLFLLSRWSGGLVDRFGPKLPLVVGPLIAAAGLLLFARPGLGTSYWTGFFPAVVLLGLGLAVSVAPLTTTVMGAVEERHVGLASGINNATSRVAGVLAIAVLGPVVLFFFRTSLGARLDALDVPAEVRAAVLAQGADLGAARLPEGVPAAQRPQLEAALDLAFLDGYRAVIYATAGLAVLAALAGSLIRARRVERPAPAASAARSAA